MWRRFLGLDADYRFKRDSFSALLSRLRSQGLVARSGPRPRSIWQITPRGRDYLRPHLMRTDGVGRVVAFDIPERERKKRDAIRVGLMAAGYHQLQQSVWYGERPLPQDFVELIDVLRLRPCVHIFSVKRSGTMGAK